MSSCKHEYLKYLGRQKFSEERTYYLELYNCISCGSTVALEEKLQKIVVIENKNIEKKK